MNSLLTISPSRSAAKAVGQSVRTGEIGVLEDLTDRQKRKLPALLGFQDRASSVHTSRTMMLRELSLSLEHVDKNEKINAYFAAILEQNVLGKPTQTTRKRTAQRLVELYTLDPTRTVFRLLRHLWDADASSQPLLTFLAATARDSLLRDTTPFVLALVDGEMVTGRLVADHLGERYPTRFKPTTLLSTAQNLASSWTQAGYLTGKVKKKRSRPVVTPVVVTFAMLLGYLCGARGKRLLDTGWTRMLDRTPTELAELATAASRQGWLNFKAAGSVIEITFPGLLTPQEEKASNESD